MATKAEVRNKVLKKLRVIGEGETPTTEAIADVEAAYDEKHAYLYLKNAINWDVDEDIPDESVRPMVAILTAELADDFSIDEARQQRLVLLADRALNQLIFIASGNYISQETEAEYY